jgi:hypothetical protein
MHLFLRVFLTANFIVLLVGGGGGGPPHTHREASPLIVFSEY